MHRRGVTDQIEDGESQDLSTIALLPSDHNDMELPRAHPRTPGSMNILGVVGDWAYVVNRT